MFRRHQPRPGACAALGASISATHRFPHLTAAHRFPHVTAPIGSRPPSERLIFRIVSESAIPADSPVGVYIVTFDRDATHISDSYLNRVRPVRPPLVASSHFTFACDKMKRHEIILNSQLSCFVDISLVPGPARSRAPPSRPPISSRTLRPPIDSRTLRPP